MSEEARHSRKDSRALRTIAGIPVDDPDIDDNDESVGLDAQTNGNTYNDNSPASHGTTSINNTNENGVGLVIANDTQPPASTPSIEKQEQTETLEARRLSQLQELKNKLSEDEHEHEHTPAEHVRDTEPWRIHICIAAHPCLCCWFWCAWFGICALIVMTVPGLLAFSTDVPFYIRDNLPTEQRDALTAGQEDASWERQTGDSNDRQQEAAATVSLQLLYRATSGSLMQEKYLKLIDEIEGKVRSASGYDTVCSRVYQSATTKGTFDDTGYKCSRQTTITSFFDKSYFLPSLTPFDYDIYPTLPNFQSYLFPSTVIDNSVELENKNYSEAFVNQMLTYWAGYDQGHGPSGDYVQKYYNGQPMPRLVEMIRTKFSYTQPTGEGSFLNLSMANLFGSLVDKNFAYDTPFDTEVKVAMSIFSFGLPLSDYPSATVDTDEQQGEMGKWCYDELHDMFTEFQKEHEDDMEFYWSCGDMGAYYSQSILVADGAFMIFTFLSVYIMMIINTGSVWLASNGMLMVFLNFLPAILLYRFIAQLQYFGTLCIMAMFIILSIGADDIFVKTAAPNEPMEKRLTATLRHAGKVMATTSLSTIFSFIGNTTSVFPAVYTFGAFAAWLVFTNYCAVVLYYPTVLAVHEKYFYTPSLKRGCCQTRKCGEKPSENGQKKCCGFDNEKPVLDSELDEEDRKRPIDKWFEYRLYPWISTRRKNLLAATFVFFMIFFYLATQLEPDPDVPQFYPAGNNYQEYGGVLSDNFASENAYQLTTNIVWGIDGIDRDGTDPTIIDDIGTVVYSDKNVSFFDPEEQKYIAQFCDDLLCIYSPYACRYAASLYESLKISDPENYGGERINVVKCFMTEFREWIETDSTASPSSTEIEAKLIEYNITGLSASMFDDCEWGVFPVTQNHCFGLLFAVLWLNEDIPTSNPDYAAGFSNYDYWKDFIWVKEKEDGAQNGAPLVSDLELKFFIVTAKTDAEFTDNFNDGIAFFDDWQDYIARWRDNEPGASSIGNADSVNDTFVDTPSTLTSIMATGPGFPYFFIQKQILREAYVGIGLSLGLAFVILTLATQNWIMSLYSVFVIFSIVACVMGFTTIMGWKLGIIEAVIYVMVVGMSVDYVVHLSEAYLASGKHFRQDRARRMLGIVGGSVLSGALSTLIGIFWLFFTTVVIFTKFGSFIFFLIAVSLTFSLIAFTAAMISFGPEGSSGNVALCAKKIWRCIKREPELLSTDDGQHVSHIEMR